MCLSIDLLNRAFQDLPLLDDILPLCLNLSKLPIEFEARFLVELDLDFSDGVVVVFEKVLSFLELEITFRPGFDDLGAKLAQSERFARFCANLDELPGFEFPRLPGKSHQ